MKTLAKLVFVTATLFYATVSTAQNNAGDDLEQLKIAAMESLVAAPPERALPLVNKVLSGDHSNELKERALFILSQIDDDTAQATLLDFAKDSDGNLQREAIRMIGIGGNKTSLENLNSIYTTGAPDVREAVLEAFLIAGDKRAIFNIAVNAQADDFERAVEMLGAMGARDELRELLSQAGPSEVLIKAYMISGDIEELRRTALDDSNPALQVEAIEAMGVVGGEEVNATLVQIYRDAKSDDIRDAALKGMMISGNDAGILELYRATDDAAAKKEMLEYLVIMDSDDIWNIIDAALDGDQ